MADKRKAFTVGDGCLAVFAFPFACGCVWAAWIMLSAVATWMSMQSWVETPALIDHVKLVSHRGRKNETYSVDARYRYVFAGQEYMGERVAIEPDYDNIGSFYRRIHKELLTHADAGTPFRCYVNPRDPSSSVLYRMLPGELLLFMSPFVLLFGGIGFGIIGAGIWVSRRQIQENRLRDENPGMPWLWKPEWKSGRIPSAGRGKMYATIAIAAIWNIVSLPPTVAVVLDVLRNEGEHALLLALLFPVAGCLLIAWAVRATTRWRRFGKSIFHMDEVPGVIGGKLSGIVEVPVKIRGYEGFRIRLTCSNRISTHAGRRGSIVEDVLWEDERVMRQELEDGTINTTSIPVAFAIPYIARDTDESVFDNTTCWRLAVTAVVPGVDYEVSFEVPVFRTPASDPHFELDESPIAKYAAQAEPFREISGQRIQVTRLPGNGLGLEFPKARNRSMAFGSVFLLFISIGTVAFYFSSDTFSPVAIPCMMLLPLPAWWVLEQCFRSYRVEARPGQLTFGTGLFSTGSPSLLESAEIESIRAFKSFTSGSTQFYTVKIKSTGGKLHTLASGIPGKTRAENIATMLTDALAGTLKLD